MGVAWDSRAYEGHLAQLRAAMKGQAFWKTAVFGTALLERQWPVYERLAVGRTWGAPKEVRKVLDRLWKAIPTGLRIQESYLQLLEEHPVEPRTEPWDALAAETVADAVHLLKVFWEKDAAAVPALAQQNLHFVELFLTCVGEDSDPKHPLMLAELEAQRALVRRLADTPNRDKPAFLEQYRAEDKGNILGERWFPQYPDYPPLKRRKRADMPPLRRTSPQYEQVQKAMQEGNDWAQRQSRLERLRRMAETRTWEPSAGETAGRPMTPADVLALLVEQADQTLSGAKECYVCTGDGLQTRALYDQAARSFWAAYALVDRGWPGTERLGEGFGRDIQSAALCAGMGGHWELAQALLERSWTTQYPGPNCQMLRTPSTGWLDREENRVLYHLIRREDGDAKALLAQAEGPWTAQMRLLLEGDGSGLYREVIRLVRALRRHYDYQAYRPVLSFRALSLLRLARLRGVTVEVPDVVELPPALLAEEPISTADWPLIGQELVDIALSPQGEGLLAQWTTAARLGRVVHVTYNDKRGPTYD